MRGTEPARDLSQLLLFPSESLLSSLLFRTRLPRGTRPVVAAVGAIAMALTGAGSAHAAGNVEVTSAFASPIVATRADTKSINDRYLCTPEPSGQIAYGTDGVFNPNVLLSVPTGKPKVGAPGDPDYVPANLPSIATQQVPAVTAGTSNDLCFGFTLPPDLEPYALANGKRFQNSPNPIEDVADTHIINDAGDAIDGDDMKTVKVDLPAGFLGDPDSGPQCTAEEFGADNYAPADCPSNTQVGTAFVRLTTLIGGTKIIEGNTSTLFTHLVMGGAANQTFPGLSSGGLVYNLAHGPNELAKLAIVAQPAAGYAPVKFVVRLATTPDGRVTTTTEAPRNIYSSSQLEPVTNPSSPLYDPTSPLYGKLIANPQKQPLYVESFAVRAWGSKADHPTLTTDFAQWGTDCNADLSARVEIETFKGIRSAATSPSFRLTGCDKLPFLPSVSFETTEKKPGVPTGVNVTLGLGQTTSGPLSALLKDASVTLPAGLEIGAQVGSRDGGLKLCSAAQFDKNSNAASTCPEGSVAGSATIISPLQKLPFVGKAYLGEQPAVGELPALYLEISPQGATAADAPRFKLVGQVTVGADGRVTTTFKDTPQLRFSELRLTFPSGPDALFSTPRKCGTTTSSSQFTSSASPTPVTVESTLTIDQECDLPAFAPTLSMTSADSTVGASAPTTVTLERPDRSAWLTKANVSLPSGFLADLNAASECSSSDAATGNCPDSSRIATVTTSAGVGSKPLSLTGKMFLSERQEGSVAGAVIVVRAKIGEIDLGDVVVPARINLRPTDAGIALTTDVPTRFRNLPLNLRTIVVSLDRTGFPLNPTACGPLRATAELSGDGGETATPTTDVTFTGCAARGLQPTITPTLSGELGAGGHPNLQVSIATRPGDSNLSATTVTMPAGISSDPKNIKNYCTPEQWNAAACPATARVGAASAKVSITPDTISGDVYLVKIPGKVLPGLGMNFTGRYAQRVLGTVAVNKDLRLVAAFDSIPDLPLTKLDLTVDGGAKSPIVFVPEACSADSDWKIDFSGQGGQKASQTIPVPCDAAPKPALSWSAKAGLKVTLAAPAGKTLKTAKLTMPKGFKLTRAKAKLKKFVKVAATGGSAKSKFSSTSITLTGKGAGPKQLVVTLKPGSYTVPKSYLKAGKLKKGKKVTIKTRVVTSSGKVGTASTVVKVR